VFVHPLGVSTALTIASPGAARLRTLLFVGFFVGILAFVSDSRAIKFVLFAGITARLHTVEVHPFGVFLAFASFVFARVGPRVTRRMLVGDTEITSVLFGADTDSQSVSTGADRAARSGTVLKHPRGIDSTFRRVAVGPGRALGETITTLGSVFGAELSVFPA